MITNADKMRATGNKRIKKMSDKDLAHEYIKKTFPDKKWEPFVAHWYDDLLKDALKWLQKPANEVSGNNKV